ASTLPVTSATTAPPAAGPITGDLDVCINQTNLTYTIAPVANASAYTWTVPTGWTITSGNNTNTITVTAGNSAGTITVRPRNGCGNGPVQSLTVTPVTNPPVVPGPITGTLVPCTGQSN